MLHVNNKNNDDPRSRTRAMAERNAIFRKGVELLVAMEGMEEEAARATMRQEMSTMEESNAVVVASRRRGKGGGHKPGEEEHVAHEYYHQHHDDGVSILRGVELELALIQTP